MAPLTRIALFTRLALSSAVIACAASAAGCDVEPYCFTCADSLDGSIDAGPSLDGSRLDVGPLPDVGALDAWDRGDGCLGAELCNDLDDDCDTIVDEGIDLSRDPRNCGGCGRACRAVHAFPSCMAGVCGIEACDVGWLDLDMDPSNGCEYRCLRTADDDLLCNLRDDDCDGRVDEDVDRTTDPVNCGRCGRVCRAVHATGSCEGGECVRGDCDPGFYDIDGRADTGCEYACTIATPAVEICNARDDDCDGTVDEGNPGAGAACGDSTGACVMGMLNCVMGSLTCVGGVSPSTETCDGTDDDCDGVTDEGNPQGGRVCGTSTGLCDPGRDVCMGGSLVCAGETGPAIEACNTFDDDCDGLIDEGNPGGGAACGETTGACEAGAMMCMDGAVTCVGGTGPRDELCNGVDDDCDGATDEGDPETGALCGTDVGRCSPGTRRCTAGVLSCVGAVGPGVETCDATDEDCDGSVDEGNPGGGTACGTTTGECAAGMQVCRIGTLVCEGGTPPVAETCNMRDDDCDGATDETFSFATDIRNCGGCGVTCAFPNAVPRCSGGTCSIAGCLSGFHDLDPVAPGCEYACSFRGAESCNGIDDDCDGRTDESLMTPAFFCNPNGVCAGTTATCGGAAGWSCSYPATHRDADSICDNLDNDCDGRIDEGFPLAGTSCSNGLGTCRRTGSYLCNGAGDGVQCSAPPAGMSTPELCNGLDDDCDGLIDEPDDPAIPGRDGIDVSAIDSVVVSLGGGATVRVMSYEASRPDATATSGGALSTVACSRPNVQPWTSLTWAQAQSACCALNPGGTCGATGWRLCDAPHWQTACRGPAGTCNWSYSSSCSSSQPLTCNGAEHDSDPTRAGDQDAVYTTGSASFPMCGTSWGGAGTIRDMSGNVREWTATPGAPGFYQVRGGSYQSIEAGRACTFSFTVAATAGSAPNTGFRCCMY